ncbi:MULTISPECIES: hypothetical protein [Pseudomonas]|uniref:Uncharacterized protein n=1 Tax=Pseudomonas fulva TaxID=47880 RepID=A0A0D0JNV1_9PSED|nr:MULTISPECIES: hypothetical protein [Pseudomonas]KIP97013.1 hypothetical protein RU08_19340 [Pseudomonas fulva]
MANQFQLVTTTGGAQFMVNSRHVIAMRYNEDGATLFVSELKSDNGRMAMNLSASEAREVQGWLEQL